MKIFADGPAATDISRLIVNFGVSGITTNPTLAKPRYGSTHIDPGYYEAYCRRMARVAEANDVTVSLEVLATEPTAMVAEAHALAALSDTVYVKIPCQTIHGQSTVDVVWALSKAGVKVNVTALTTALFIKHMDAVDGGAPSILSVFAGRIADTGIDPSPIMRSTCEFVHAYQKKASRGLQDCEVLWASCREPLNIVQAEQAGCDIITVPVPILEKWKRMRGQSLDDVSLDTVRQFAADSRGMSLENL